MRSNKRTLISNAEERKVEIQQLPYESNLEKLTKLNLKGETKTKYDALKKATMDNTTNYLAPVEEKLQSAEEQLDKFKFSAAQNDIDDANELMDHYEEGYQSQLKEVDEIVALHKDSDSIYQQCKTNYREMKRDVLANRHQYGEAAAPLEQQIEQFEPQLDQFETLKAEGNYVQAHNHIAGLNETMTQLKTYMEEIPN